MTRSKIELVVDCLWDETKAMPWEKLCCEVEAWVVDPSNTTGRVVAYDKLLILYLVNINLIAHSSLSIAAKQEGDEEPVRVWKEHNVDCHLMHIKTDIMATKMGIEFFHPRMEQVKV